MTDIKDILTGLFEEIERVKKKRPSPGTRYRLMALVADITEVTEHLSREVLERVKQEAVLDVDVDVDFDVMAEEVLSWELVMTGDDLLENIQLGNDALGGLSDVLTQISSQLERSHKDEEYARLYEQEKRRYLNSGTPRRVRQTFEDWLYDVCNGTPSMDDINDYVTEKLVHMFEKGVFNTKVEHIQRASRYPGEFDFSQLDDDHKLKKSIHKHYSELRKLVDYCDGCLVVNPVKVGRHFYANRKEENARGHRNAFLKYMHKITLAQQERKKLLESEVSSADASATQLNYFAPTKNLKVLLNEEWFEIHRTDKCYDAKWSEDFVNALMKSEHRDYIATEWSKDKRQDYIRGCVLGLLKEGGVIKGSMDSIARSANVCDNYRTFSRYMGQSRQEPYADWVLDYLRPAEK